MNGNENYLTAQQLEELDRQIDALIPSFSLLQTNRRLALRAVLTGFDAIIQQFGSQPDLSQRMLNYRVAYQSLDHAIRWIYDNCPESTSFVPENVEALAIELLSLARDYHYIFVQMSLTFQGRNKITITGDNRFRVNSANAENQRLETARSLIAAAQFPDTHEKTVEVTDELANTLRKSISITGTSGRQLRYTFSDDTFEKAAAEMEMRKLYQWSMNPEWDLGGYSFAEVRRVWSTLKTLQALHQLALQKLPRQVDRWRFNLKIRPRDEWIREISQYSMLSSEVVQRVFNDLVYDPRLHKPGTKKGHVMYQPFIEIGPNEIAQSNALVMISVVEKCSWILTELIRPEIHSRLKNLKERYWIENEFQPFESDRNKVFPHIKFKYEQTKGDIDLLLLDVDDNFGLVCQLKWATGTDNVAGVESEDKQYAKGVDQAIVACQWAENNRAELARRIEVPESLVQSSSFRPLVIAKETLPSGTFDNRGVPVINEVLFRWIMNDPHHATLRELWEAASKADYLPKEGIHFSSDDPDPLVWGDMEFLFEDVAYVPLPRRWNPATDLVIGKGDETYERCYRS